MTFEEFAKAFRIDIDDAVARINRRYGVADEDMSRAIYHSVKKYFPDVSSETCKPEDLDKSHGRVSEFIRSLNCEDLCMATACARGIDEAWEDFFRDYRSYMVSIARSVTQDTGAAEQLADSTFAELYGMRESGGVRVSKFAFYSGRGSMRGWLRAVVFQLSADLHRKTGRFVQTEEPEDLERMASVLAPADNSSVELEFVKDQYRTAISESLRIAVSQLEARERLLLAHYYYDEMTLREIGKLFGVHEATICRWLTKTQTRTRKLVEKSLTRDHHFNRRQVKEAIDLAAEKVDVSISDYLLGSMAKDRKVTKETEPPERAAVSLRLD
jgi:RNA polymerase sigma-70 factor